MGQEQPIRKVTSDIPDKLYFRIGEVSRICEVPAYVLRFWESEFSPLRPNKGGTGQRLYRRRDVETALRIKCLLYDEGYTIPGARQILKSEGKHKEPQLPLAVGAPLPPGTRQQLESLHADLKAILAILAGTSESAATVPIRSLKAARSRSQQDARPGYAQMSELVTLFDRPTSGRSGEADDRSPQLDSESKET